MQQSDYEIVGKFGFESRPHRRNIIKPANLKFAGFIHYTTIIK